METKSKEKTAKSGRESRYLNVQCNKRKQQQPQELPPSKIAKFSTVVLENLKPLQKDDGTFSSQSAEDNFTQLAHLTGAEDKETHTIKGTRSNLNFDTNPSNTFLKVDTKHEIPQVAQAIPVLVTDRETRSSASDPDTGAKSSRSPNSLGYLGLVRAAMDPERKKEFNKERRGGKQNAKLLARKARRYQEQLQLNLNLN